MRLVERVDNLFHLHVPTVLKSCCLKFLENSGPAHACTGIALPFYYAQRDKFNLCITFSSFQYMNPNKIYSYMLQSLFYLTTALHISGVTITHLQEHKTTVTTASGNRYTVIDRVKFTDKEYRQINPLNPELNPICYLLVLLGAHHFLHVSRIRVKSLTFRLLMSYIRGPFRN